MNVTIISTCYKKQIDGIYKKNSFLGNLTSKKEMDFILKSAGSHFYYWSQYLWLKGIKIDISCIDLEKINKKWALENNKDKSTSLQNLFIQKIKSFNPDILIVFSPYLYLKMIGTIKENVPSIKKIVAWYGADQGDEKKTFSKYDLILTNSKILRDRLILLGLNSEILQHSFENSIYGEIRKKYSNQRRKNRLVFTGTLGLANPDHSVRYNNLENLSATVPIDLFSDDVPYQKTRKHIFIETRYRFSKILSEKLGNYTPTRLKSWGEKSNQPHFPPTTPNHLIKTLYNAVYGRDMLKKLYEYNICFNSHNLATGDSACNMRLFEATGMGCCLLTDYKTDISSLFEPDFEIVTYDSVEEAKDKAKYLIENPRIAKEIATAGQRKTLIKYNTEQQSDQLAFLLIDLLES